MWTPWRTLRTIVAFLGCLALCVPAGAQTAPYVYGKVLTTAPQQVLPVNAQRKRAIFHNPNAAIFIAVCPNAPDRGTGAVFTPRVNGPGCITIVPLGDFSLDSGLEASATLYVGVAWNALATANGAAITILEFQ